MDRLVQYPGSLLLAIALGGHGLRKGSLSLDGAIAAAVLGFLTLAAPLRVFGVALLVRSTSIAADRQVFYFTGSRATKHKAQIKAGLESERSQTAAEGQRNATQVACNACRAKKTRVRSLSHPSPRLDRDWPHPSPAAMAHKMLTLGPV